MKKLFLTLVILFSYPQLSHTLERFIPLELFTGSEIRKDTEIKFTKADKIFSEKKIIGSVDQKNPQAGETIKVYKRTRKDQSGLKIQLFIVTNNEQCIGRVWYSRRGGKVIENGCKFPLWNWKEGETRYFKSSSGGKLRKIELTILKLGKKTKSSIKFNWKLYNLSLDELMYNNDYTFSRGKAMTKLNDKKLVKYKQKKL